MPVILFAGLMLNVPLLFSVDKALGAAPKKHVCCIPAFKIAC